MTTGIADYDSNGYDYRTYWDGRDYERRAEDRALRRLVPRLGPARWFVDLGGGFGRNARHYRASADRYVVVDYSATNLANATQVLAADIAAGRAFLVRADLHALPFADRAFDAAMVVRVLHHLADLPAALAEMGRVVNGRWLVDVPIKHHVFGLARAAGRRDWRSVRGPGAVRTTAGEEPFWNFRLSAVRRTLAGLGWRTRPVASVNNLRRWDRRLAPRVARAVLPAVQAAEALVQRIGTGWWGPNQFVLAERVQPPARRVESIRIWPQAPAVAMIMRCPRCRGELDWTAAHASCVDCQARYGRVDGYWDFTTVGAVTPHRI
jgi:SAM-dependent methyltransferase